MENVTCFMGPTTKAPSLFACRTLKVKQNKNKDNCLICIYYCLLGRWIPVASLGDRDNKGWSDFNHNGLVDPSEIYAPYQYDTLLFLSFLFCLLFPFLTFLLLIIIIHRNYAYAFLHVDKNLNIYGGEFVMKPSAIDSYGVPDFRVCSLSFFPLALLPIGL